VEIAERNNPFEVAWSTYYRALLRLSAYMRDHQQAEALAERALELSEKNQFPNVAAYSRCVLGVERAGMGRTSEGIALIRQGLTDLRAVAARLGIGTFITYLAAAQAQAGAIIDALATIEEALRTNPDQLLFRPEILRIRGELRLKHEEAELAEADFREAIALARKMSAKAWKLRSTMSLARLLDRQDKRDEARAMLRGIYNWFTEGFDTADLIEAKRLLDEL
jgi:tetratricopeptide (TPR) repeat protein